MKELVEKLNKLLELDLLLLELEASVGLMDGFKIEGLDYGSWILE